MAIETEAFVVIEAEPLKGVKPEVKFFETRKDARDWIETRLSYFGRFDLAAVKARVTVEYRMNVSEITDSTMANPV